MDFINDAKLLGKGSQAEIYFYEGYAYKVFKKGYPVEYINGEFYIQTEVNKTNLRTIKYYKTDDDHVLKMDYIDGITMAEKMRKAKGFKDELIDIINIQKQITNINNLRLLTINNCYKDYINNSMLNEDYKKTALTYLNSIEEKNNLCHLDFHMLNIMCSNKDYIIIDWPNAKNGNPIHDYARTYIIMYEHAFRLSKTYLSLIEKDSEIDTHDLNKAIYIAALIRYNESKNEKLIDLLENIKIN